MNRDNPSRAACRAVRAIVEDLSDRRGLGGAWDSIDDDAKQEIAREWALLIDHHLSGGE